MPPCQHNKHIFCTLTSMLQLSWSTNCSHLVALCMNKWVSCFIVWLICKVCKECEKNICSHLKLEEQTFCSQLLSKAFTPLFSAVGKSKPKHLNSRTLNSIPQYTIETTYLSIPESRKKYMLWCISYCMALSEYTSSKEFDVQQIYLLYSCIDIPFLIQNLYLLFANEHDKWWSPSLPI